MAKLEQTIRRTGFALMILAIFYGLYRAQVDSIKRHETQQTQIVEQQERDLILQAIGSTLLPRLVCDSQLNIKVANTPCAQLMEISHEELLGKDVCKFIPKEIAAKQLTRAQQYLQDASNDVFGHRTSCWLKSAKGRRKKVHLYVAPIPHGDEVWFALKFKKVAEELLPASATEKEP